MINWQFFLLLAVVTNDPPASVVCSCVALLYWIFDKDEIRVRVTSRD